MRAGGEAEALAILRLVAEARSEAEDPVVEVVEKLGPGRGPGREVGHGLGLRRRSSSRRVLSRKALSNTDSILRKPASFQPLSRASKPYAWPVVDEDDGLKGVAQDAQDLFPGIYHGELKMPVHHIASVSQRSGIRESGGPHVASGVFSLDPASLAGAFLPETLALRAFGAAFGFALEACAFEACSEASRARLAFRTSRSAARALSSMSSRFSLASSLSLAYSWARASPG